MMRRWRRRPVRGQTFSFVRSQIVAALLAFSVLWAPESTAAATDEPPAGCCGLAYAYEDEPPWLRRVLLKLRRKRPPYIRLHDHRLFKHAGRPSYLVLIWDNLYSRIFRFQVYRVRVRSPGDVRLSGLLEFTDAYLDLVPPTGIWVDQDGAPLVVLSFGSGGNAYDGYYIRIYRLRGGITDVTPDGMGRPTEVRDVDGDGEFDVITSDDRWGNFYWPCGQCGPLIPVVLQRTPSGYRPKCRDAQTYYDAHILRVTNRLTKFEDDDPTFVHFESRIYAVLSRIQSGRIERAKREYLEFLAEARVRIKRIEALGKDAAVEKKHDALTEREFPAVIAEAERHASSQCPLSATSAPGAHYSSEVYDYLYGARQTGR